MEWAWPAEAEAEEQQEIAEDEAVDDAVEHTDFCLILRCLLSLLVVLCLCLFLH